MKTKIWLWFVIIGILVGFAGCMKPPITEKYEEVSNNETAFVVQLEGKGQSKIDSLEALKAMQISSKRIQIPQRYKSVGRMWWQAKIVPTVIVIKVDRSPVTREWAAEKDLGTSNKNEGIWVESRDSIGFSTGFNCTAMVAEENAAQFLYFYPGGSLATVMDNQIRNEIQAVASEAAAQWDLDECREKKLDIIASVREKVIPKFAETGITIKTIGMFGGFKYEEPEIQTAINKTFIAQQEKVIAKAEFQAQEDRNNRVMKEAVGLKSAAITKAEGEAKAVMIKAEAASIKAVALAAADAKNNSVFVQLKQLEVEMARLKVWNGQYPQWYMGSSGENMGLIINPPMAAAKVSQ